MNNISIILLLGIATFVLIGCTNNSDLESMDPDQPIQFTNINTSSDLDQGLSNQAKDSLSQNKNVTSVKAVNTSKNLIIAVEVPHMKRFRLKKIQKEIVKEMKKEFSRINVEVSTDQKVILEIDQLEDKLQSDSITKKELEKKITSIIDLMKEKT